MEDVNKKIFIEYVSHLYSTDKSYEVIGKSIKAVKLFLYLYILPKLGPYLSNYFTSYSVLRQNYHNLFFLLYRNF